MLGAASSGKRPAQGVLASLSTGCSNSSHTAEAIAGKGIAGLLGGLRFLAVRSCGMPWAAGGLPCPSSPLPFVSPVT